MESSNFLAATYMIPLVVFALVLPLWYVGLRIDWRARTRGIPLPPGPKPLPIVGNLYAMPTIRPWLAFRDMHRAYGDLVYLRVLGQGMLIIGSTELATEFLGKHTANSSDRQQSLVAQLCGQGFSMAFMSYGQWWRDNRRTFWQHFHSDVIPAYHTVQRTEAYKLLPRLLESPLQLEHHIRHVFLGTMLKVVYDIDIAAKGREYLFPTVNDAMEAIALANPGAFAVEMFPVLRHVPEWFPGAGFQKLFAKSKAASDRIKHELFEETQISVECGEQRPCIATDLIGRMKEDPSQRYTPEEEIELLKNVCTVAIEGGADTTFAALQAFFVAMALNPGVQRKAQAELDAVVGLSRLPDHADSDTLVYVNALIKEVFRWHVILPLGLAHRTVKDDELRGCFIPAGTLVMPNVWEMSHDPNVYEDPFAFRPERFIRDGKLDPAVPDPTAVTFGFGRRICPGRHFAQSALFVTVASVLHTLDIGLPLGKDGCPIQIEYKQSHGFLTYPEDIRCSIKARSTEALALIMDAQKHFAPST